METSRACFLALSAVIAAATLSGCGRGSDSPVKVTYRQVGICKGFETGSGPLMAKADEGYAFFKFETVENPSSKAFVFDPKLLFVDQSTAEQKAGQVWEWNRRYATTDSRFKQLGIPLAAETTIPAGGKADINAFVVVPLGIDNPSKGPESDKFAFDVVYDSMNSENTASGQIRISEGMLFNKTNASQKDWTVVEDCKDVNFK